jgi:hypothetical protein
LATPGRLGLGVFFLRGADADARRHRLFLQRKDAIAMSQSELDRLVASATGESRVTVRQLGFSLADPLDVAYDPEPGDDGDDRYLDWDLVADQRFAELAVH